MKNNMPFCTAPWNHLSMRASHKFGLCCVSEYADLEATSFEDHWNSEFMKRFRVQMMNGIPDPKLCERCLDKKTTTRVHNKWYNEVSKPFLTEILDKTESDGTTTYYPKTIDLRTDLCNFKCRTCGPHSSTSIQKESIANSIPIHKKGVIENFNQFDLTEERIKNLKDVYWAGGEPFMFPLHWEVMEKLIDVKNTDCEITYITNLSFPGKTIHKAIDLLKNFSKVSIFASLDGIGEDGEYIRDGLDYQKFLDNLNLVRKEISQAEVFIVYTATSIGLLNFYKLIQLCLDLNISIELNSVFLKETNHYLQINVLNLATLNKSLELANKIAIGTYLEESVLAFTALIKEKYSPVFYDKDLLHKQEKIRGKEGYFEKRMKEFINQENDLLDRDTSRLPFCCVPWNQLHVTASKNFGLCCMSKWENKEATSFEEHWNSTQMKQLRLDMINHKPPKDICVRCLSDKMLSNPSYKWRNKYSEDQIFEIYEKTAIDGSSTFSPKMIEIRTDLCNLSCRMCDANSSTAVRGLLLKQNKEVPPCGVIDTFEKTGLNDESLKNLQYATWAGGEPFMSPIHWSTMEKLVSFGNTNLQIKYNTNLTFPGKSFDHAVELLKHFSKVQFIASLDATNEDVEYIREGLDYQKFVENIRRVKDQLSHIEIIIGYTATSLGLLTLDKVVQLCLDYDLGFEGRKVALHVNAPLSINILTTKILNQSLTRAKKVAKGTKLESILDSYAEFLTKSHIPLVYDKSVLNKHEGIRGKAGYFEKRMKGKTNE